MTQAAAFYCLADERYFLGAVGLVNSLRLVGHREPIYILDCGLSAEQRVLLEPEATVVAAPTNAPPYLLKTIAPLRHPAEVMVMIDADMIVTRPLAELIERASHGRVVAFENDRDRFCPQWGELLDLGTSRRQPYVSVGLVFLGGAVGAEVAWLMDDRQLRIDFRLTAYGENARDYPFLYPEQDVLNAILTTRVKQEQLIACEHRLAPTPPYPGLRLDDERNLVCSYGDGSEPYVLHQFVRKPWLEPMYHGIYPRLLARLLLGQDVAIKVPESDVPRRMRSGALARLERAFVNVGDLGRWYLLERPSRWTGSRLRKLRHTRPAGDR